MRENTKSYQKKNNKSSLIWLYGHGQTFLLRYSIDYPSIVHRFDGEVMEKRWTNNEGIVIHQPYFFAEQIELISSNKQG